MSTPTKYDDLYYNDQPVGWEVMFAWDNDFNEFAMLVHPDHGTFYIRDEVRVAQLKSSIKVNYNQLSIESIEDDSL